MGVGVVWALFWVRLELVAIYVGVPAVLLGVTVWWTARRARRDLSGQPARRARYGRLTGLGIGALVGALTFWDGQGLLAPAVVVTGYLMGVLFGELLAAPTPSGPVRVASLRPRTGSAYLPRWPVRLALAAGLVTVVSPLLFVLLPRLRYGPWQPFVGQDAPRLPGGTLSWPSLETSVPLALGAVVVIVAGAVVVRRLAVLPPVSPDQSTDEQARRNSVWSAVGAVLGVELLLLAATVISASEGLAVPGAGGGAAYQASRALVWSGLGLALTAVMVGCALGRWRRLPAAESATANPHPLHP